MELRHFMEANISYFVSLFFISFFVKIINYSIFDRYETDFGSHGSLLIGIFIYYKKEDIEKEMRNSIRISRIINNICSWIIFPFLIIGVISLFYFFD